MITQSQIDGAFRRAAALPVGKKIEIKDDGEQGAGRLALILRRGKNEVTAHWFALWWRSGRRQYTKIKSYSEMSLKGARAAFRAEYTSAISLGADPALAAGGPARVRDFPAPASASVRLHQAAPIRRCAGSLPRSRQALNRQTQRITR